MEQVQPRRITRLRELRACTECRRRKLKCDRQLPCTACVRREEAASCVYERRLDGAQNGPGRLFQLQARLEYLERLVQEKSRAEQELERQSIEFPGAESDPPSGADVPSRLVPYQGATHWSAMLEDIEELRNAIGDSDDLADSSTDPAANESDGLSMLFGSIQVLPFQQVLHKILPQRHEADRIVAAYFRTKALVAPFLHAAQFGRLYRLFWEDPSAAPPLWASILFSVLDIAMRTLPVSDDATGGHHLGVKRFALASAQCLVIGKYYKPQQFAVEALTLYAQARCITSSDISADLATLFGTLARLATNMGYHRDPDGFRASMSAFEGEMRRRTFSICMQLDMLVSFQVGLPNVLQSSTWDTKPPTNLLDIDFDETSLQLPVARPESEPTELLFYIAKHRLMVVFAKILRHTLSATARPSDELAIINQELRVTYKALPKIYQPRLMTDSIVDSPSIIVSRFCVHIIYQKCLCALHRRHVIAGEPESIRVSHEASSELIKLFLDTWAEFEPGGQLFSERWFQGGITWHDFLQGCTALCLTICSCSFHAVELIDTVFIDVVRSLHLLENAKALCESQAGKSKDTRKVQRVVEATIRLFSSGSGDAESQMDMPRYNEQFLSADQSGSDKPFTEDNTTMWAVDTMQPENDDEMAWLEQYLDIPSED